ncbi:MAG: Lrp/AsnC family transcriptional regulator [Candidatus Bathyarchaeia archaeon]
MPTAFVLINVESGSEEEALRDLRKITGVVESYTSYGVYDIITKVQASSMDELKDLITLKIRNVSKVRSTLTLILAED